MEKRDIKFRGKRVNGEWIYGGLVKWDDRAFIIPQGCSLRKTASLSNEHIVSAYEVSLATVGQFTGEFDDEGTDIYEDDILMAWGRHEEQPIPENKVPSDSFIVTMPNHMLSFPVYIYKVVGNIHEHKVKK